MIDTHQDGIVSVDEFLAFVGSDLGWLTTRQVCVCVCVWLGRMIGLCVCVCVARPHDRVVCVCVWLGRMIGFFCWPPIRC